MKPVVIPREWLGLWVRIGAVWWGLIVGTSVALASEITSSVSTSSVSASVGNGVSPGAEPVAARMFPLRIEATYGLSSADIEAPFWTRSRGSVLPDQRSTTGYFTDQRVTAALSWRMPNDQSLRVGLGFVRSRSGSALISSAESVPYLWRAWGLGSEVSLVRRLGRDIDVDAGIVVDVLMSGVATFEARDLSGASAVSKAPNRVAMASGWRTAWQVGLGGWYWGPVGLTWRVGGSLTYATFDGHPKALEAQAIATSLGMCFELGREGP